MQKPSVLQKLQRGTYGAGGEKIDWTYWDTLVLATATTMFRLFVNPLGSGGKTLADTNMTSAGVMPQGQHLTVHALKLFYVSNAAHNTAAVQSLYSFLRATTLEFIIPGKYTIGQWTLAEMMGTSSLFAVTPTAAGDNIPLIQPTFKGVFPLNTPITLAALTPFEVQIQMHVASAAGLDGDRVLVGLNGKLLRSS
jgi:hypothetical protein